MQSPPISQAEISERISDHIDELLQLWWAEQGASKPNDLELIASTIPFARGDAIRALDLCCGPGDVGRAIRRLYPHAVIDGIDRDPFLASICKEANRRSAVPGKIVVKDLHDVDWRRALEEPYDVVATVNALHWFTRTRATEVIAGVHAMLRARGVFLLAEPVNCEEPFAAGFEEWKQKQPQRYSHENWQRFWSRANALLGYDHIKLLGSRHGNRIGDEGISVSGWIGLLETAGFHGVDVLLRDADQAIIAAVKSA